jgi:hypothetical protein
MSRIGVGEEITLPDGQRGTVIEVHYHWRPARLVRATVRWLADDWEATRADIGSWVNFLILRRRDLLVRDTSGHVGSFRRGIALNITAPAAIRPGLFFSSLEIVVSIPEPTQTDSTRSLATAYRLWSGTKDRRISRPTPALRSALRSFSSAAFSIC